MVEKREIEMINEVFDFLPDEITEEDIKKLDDVINYLEWTDSKKREKLYSMFITTIIQFFLGTDDKLKKIKIYGKNEKEEPYIITIE
jgi:hypothetical protein